MRWSGVGGEGSGRQDDCDTQWESGLGLQRGQTRSQTPLQMALIKPVSITNQWEDNQPKHLYIYT